MLSIDNIFPHFLQLLLFLLVMSGMLKFTPFGFCLAWWAPLWLPTPIFSLDTLSFFIIGSRNYRGFLYHHWS